MDGKDSGSIKWKSHRKDILHCDYDVVTESNSDKLSSLPPNIYCDLVSTLDKRCAQ